MAEWDDESQDPNEGFEPEEEDTGTDDPLSDLEPEMRAKVEALVAQGKADVVASVREKARSRGLDIAEDFEVVQRDPQALRGWLGSERPERPEPAPAAAAAVKPAPAEEEDEEIDLYSLDGKQLHALIEKKALKVAEKMVAPLTQQNQMLQSLVMDHEASRATTQLEQAVKVFNPGIADYLEHPDFAATFQQQAVGLTKEQLRDPRMLAAAAGMCVPFLDLTRQPEKRPRDDRGQSVSDSQVQRTLARENLSRTAPSRDVGARPESGERDQRRRVAKGFLDRYFGETDAAQIDALEYESIDQYQAALNKARRK